MLENARVTVFTVFELLRENQQGGKVTPTKIRVKKKKMKSSRNHMKMKISVLFVKKIEDKYDEDKKYFKIRDHCPYTGEYRGAAHSICNSKDSVPKKFPIAFCNG